MKITALEIRQKAFEKEFRGYKKDEVDAFLLSLSSVWESMVAESKELKIRLEQAEKEVQKLREVEDSLFKTLKTAETTGASMVEQANKAAELLMKETKLKAEQLYNDAQNKSDLVIARMQNEIRELEQDYRAIENQRDTLIREIKSLSADTLERVNKVSGEKKDLSNIRERAQNLGAELRNATSMHEPLKEFDIPSIEVPKVEPPKETTEAKKEIQEETTNISSTEKSESATSKTTTPDPVTQPKPKVEETQTTESTSEKETPIASNQDSDNETNTNVEADSISEGVKDDKEEEGIKFGEPEHESSKEEPELTTSAEAETKEEKPKEETQVNSNSEKDAAVSKEEEKEADKKEKKSKKHTDGSTMSFFDEISE